MTRSTDIANALRRARAHHEHGQLLEAEALYSAILKLDPSHFDAQSLLGVIESQRGNFEAAVSLFTKASRLDPKCALVHSSIGNALLALHRHEEAVASFDRALAIESGHPEVLNNRGNALFALERHDEALDSYDRALAIKSDSAEVLNNRGNVLRDLRRHEAALASYDRALAIRPHYAEALSSRGAVLRELKRHGEAVANYDRAVAIKPEYAEALNDRGNALLELERHEEAIASYDRALAIKPQFAEAHYNRGVALSALGRHADAACQFARLLRIEPDFPYARGDLLHSQPHCCNWNEYAQNVERIKRGVVAGRRAATPFAFLSASGSPSEQLQCAKIYCKDKYAASNCALWTGERYRHDRLRVAYISADFHNHATAYLTAELFELHDKSRFETHAISLGAHQRDEMRARLEKAFAHFVEVRNRSDRDVALLLRELEIDIAVDLQGHTQDSRPGILALRPAPVQVNYLGYPGTMGAEFIDYILADRFTVPEEQRSCYTEKVAYLPDMYQPNDSKRRIAEETPTRREAGLPETGFIFCAFVSTYKIVPAVFDAWMRLLAKVDGSVLWLLAGNADAVANLRRSAGMRGIDPDRLVFAPRIKLEHHLSRHRLADLFLDTLPVNAHTTASDALWAGVPIVTCRGPSFAGRVAGSLLTSLGLTELITGDLAEYESLAFDLARDTGRLMALRETLAQNRRTHPLFNIDRLRRHIETAFEVMSERCQRGERPASFSVAAIARRQTL